MTVRCSFLKFFFDFDMEAHCVHHCFLIDSHTRTSLVVIPGNVEIRTNSTYINNYRWTVRAKKNINLSLPSDTERENESNGETHVEKKGRCTPLAPKIGNDQK